MRAGPREKRASCLGFARLCWPEREVKAPKQERGRTETRQPQERARTRSHGKRRELTNQDMLEDLANRMPTSKADVEARAKLLAEGEANLNKLSTEN